MTRLTIEALGQRGEGIAEHEGKRVFVPFALPNETVEGTNEGERAIVTAIREPSPDRIMPFCEHFGICGGCQLQHLGPELYASFKRELVETPLQRLGLIPEIAPLVDAKGEGRRRATLHARAEGVGYMQARSHQVHPIDHCPILIPSLKGKAPAIAKAVFAVLGEADVAITQSAAGPDVAIRVEKTRGKPDTLFALAKQLGLSRIALNGEMIGQAATPSIGMGPSTIELPINSFLQATDAAESILAALVLEGVGKAKSVADLFCGLGPFALRLAQTRRVFALDSDRNAIAALNGAMRHTKGLKPMIAQARDLFREPLTRYELDTYDAVVLDPPRAGAEAQCRELAASKVKTVVMVSCDAKTFARDAMILIGSGFTLGPITPVDQFAYSTHVEMVARFTR